MRDPLSEKRREIRGSGPSLNTNEISAEGIEDGDLVGKSTNITRDATAVQVDGVIP